MQIETIVRVIGANNIKVNTLNHITYNDCSLNSALLDGIVPHSFSLLHHLFDFRHHQQIILTAEKIDNIVYYICTSHWVISFNKTTDILHSSAYFCMLQLWELVCALIFAISLKILSVFVITLQQEKTKQRKDKIVTQTNIHHTSIEMKSQSQELQAITARTALWFSLSQPKFNLNPSRTGLFPAVSICFVSFETLLSVCMFVIT